MLANALRDLLRRSSWNHNPSREQRGASTWEKICVRQHGRTPALELGRRWRARQPCA